MPETSTGLPCILAAIGMFVLLSHCHIVAGYICCCRRRKGGWKRHQDRRLPLWSSLCGFCMTGGCERRQPSNRHFFPFHRPQPPSRWLGVLISCCLWIWLAAIVSSPSVAASHHVEVALGVNCGVYDDILVVLTEDHSHHQREVVAATACTATDHHKGGCNHHLRVVATASCRHQPPCRVAVCLSYTSIVIKQTGGKKRKVKFVEEDVNRKPKPLKKLKKKEKVSIVDEDMEVNVNETTVSDNRFESNVQNDENIASQFGGEDELATYDDVEGTNYFEEFMATVLVTSFIDDESDLDEEFANHPTIKKDNMNLNRKLNMLVHPTKSKRLFDEHEKVVNATTVKMDAAPNEANKLNNLILFDNTVHCLKFTESINTLVQHYDGEANIYDDLSRKDAKITSLKWELMFAKTDIFKRDVELLLFNGWNFEIKQRLVNIEEEKDAPSVDYIAARLDAKLQPIFPSCHLLRFSF
ncbi:unnamed protein product [Lactuca saligna]|uniref:Uncharacterized protein n=1 Tax=Lactuca saligna TaxID=75948 RepID=A0AA36EFV0_LACSI|nr:unnamed protein product [Lactuca saligna]